MRASRATLRHVMRVLPSSVQVRVGHATIMRRQEIQDRLRQPPECKQIA
jgi:hypothetical protein